MHYHCEVVLTDDTDLDAMMEKAKRVLDWDWFQIGGRFTGAKDGYEPDKDPRNIATCDLCAGTGKRDDPLGQEARTRDPAYTCNGCDGKGQRAKWPTDWALHGGDRIPVHAVSDDLKAFALVLPNGETLVREKWNREGKCYIDTDFDGGVAKVLRERGITEGRLITVDYHT